MAARYKILSKIAEGGLGTVFKAHDRNLDREVALKRVRADSEEAMANSDDLLKEARVLSALQHPNIVTVYDVGQDPSGPFVVMELLSGETLDQTIKRGALTKEDFDQVVIQCLEGLIAAHAKELVHRDLKPSNIMVIWHASGKFQLKILDFGLAKFSEAPSVQTTDQGDAIMGSIFFMAPEQFERTELDVRTDLYAIGAIFYYTLTGQYPFQGKSAPQVMASHLQHRYRPLSKLRPDIPEWISQWVDWLMARHNQHRPESAKVALDHFKASNPGPHAAAAQKNIGATTGQLTAAGQPASVPAVKPAASQAPTKLLLAAQTAAQTVRATPTPAPATPTPAATPEATPATGAAPVLSTGAPASGVISGAVATNTGESDQLATIELDDEGAAAAIIADDVPEKKSFFSSIPIWAWITVPALLIIGGVMFGMNKAKANKIARDQDHIESLLNEENPQGNAADVNLLMEYLMRDPDSNISVSSAQALSKIEGDGVEETMASWVPRTEGTAQVNLIRAIMIRENEAATPQLMEVATSATDERARRAALNGLSFIGRSSDVPAIIDVLAELEDDKDRVFAKEAIIAICERSVSDTGRSQAVLSALNTTSDPDTKSALLEILGRLGGKTALTKLTAMLTKDDTKVDAARALGEWQSGEPLPALLDFIKANESELERVVGIQSMTLIANRPNPYPHEKTAKILEEAANLAPRPREKSHLAMTISSLSDPEAAAAIKRLAASDERLKRTEDQLIKQQSEAAAKVIPINGATTLSGASANLFGEGASLSDGIITNWRGLDAYLRWEINVTKPGDYAVISVTSSEAKKPGVYSVSVAGERFTTSPKVGGFNGANLGKVTFKEAGFYNIWLSPLKITEDTELMDLKEIRLEPK